MNRLDPLHFPLGGSHLIEASAGTGKTFTIAMLYLRLVLGHGGANGFRQGEPLTPPDILVVTFTEAATRELRDRIRARLHQASRYFRAEDDASSDPLLAALRADYPPDQWPACARRLEVAAEWMDEAAVSTIHAWCNRMLREHAFDSQSLFSLDLDTDQRQLRGDAARDYWRIFYTPLPAADIARVRRCWQAPSALEKAVKPLLDHAELLADTPPPAEILRTCREARDSALADLKAPWPDWTDQLQELFDAASASKQVDGRKLRKDYYSGWFAKLRQWATSDDSTLDLKTGWQRLTPEGLAEAWKTTPPTHPALDALLPLQAALAALPEPDIALLQHAARWIAGEMAAVQRRRARNGFQDLLTGLDAALGGASGERLAELVRRQFPVALIDEFQDTDPIQYRIFDRIYRVAANDPDTALILIGDPKQAIYAFRGADIFTYLQARRAVAGRLHTLDTNFRSTRALVDATNHCFRRREDEPHGPGAFRFRRGDDNPVPFLAVNANGRREQFQVAGQTPPALVLTALPVESDDRLSKGRYLERMADICASQIVDWLNDPGAGFAGDDGGWRPLQPSDLAVLVNNGNEASAIRQALSRRAVRSVYLSDKDTVYATPQAGEVYRWLLACAAPDNDRLLRAALSTPSLGLSLAELDALNQDEEAWEARVLQFKGYREVWQTLGVLPALRQLLRDFACHDRLLRAPPDALGQTGERILTDLLHLTELLQTASHTLEGEHGLIRFLAEQIADPEDDTEVKKLRLESDGELLKVVTIHKSKGLEYPVVLLPFICACRPTKKTDVPLKWHDDTGALHLALAADDDSLGRTEEERLAEDLRKLYVALTRARHLTWLGLAAVNNEGTSAIDDLFGLADVGARDYVAGLRTLADGHPQLALHEAPTPHHQPCTRTSTRTTAGQARRPVRRAREDWRIASYSSLPVSGWGVPAATPAEDSPVADNLLEGLREAVTTAREERLPSGAIHRFPKGAEAGTFLHALLEWAAKEGFEVTAADHPALRDQVARRCQVRGWEQWIDPLCQWIGGILTKPFPVDGAAIRLAELDQCRAELEFWFEARQVDLAALDAAVNRHTLAQASRPPLAADTLNGMLKGYIDLVFCHGGRYYVADYKSNWLGPADADYGAAAMADAIRAHRYDLQYVLYLLALHRLLRSRLPDYDYDRHVGGAVYLFLRGLAAPEAGVHFERPPRELIDTVDALFAGASGGDQ